MVGCRNVEANQDHGNALALPLAYYLPGQLLLAMRPPIRGAIAFLLTKPDARGRKRIDWTLVLAWAGIVTALSIVALVLTLR